MGGVCRQSRAAHEGADTVLTAPSVLASPRQARIAVIILTGNEAVHVERAIRSVSSFAAQTLVVDSFSTDDTIAIARGAGALAVAHPFVTQALQFQWALDNLPLDAEWVMRLDADEVPTDELVEEIRRRLSALPSDVAGVNLRRRHVFLGRWIRHGGRYPVTLLRIWRKGAARVERRWMDEHMVLLRGRAITFDHDFSDHNLSDLSAFTAKHNGYATREAIDILTRRYGLAPVEAALSRNSASRQAAAKRRIKQRIYNRLPFWLGPFGYFLYRYFVRMGFLDGPEGLVYHVLQGFWYRFLVGAKVLEFDRELRPLHDHQARLATLARLAGYKASDFDGG